MMLSFTPTPQSNHSLHKALVGSNGYHRDPRWIEVRRLRTLGEHEKANALVQDIKESWGVD